MSYQHRLSNCFINTSCLFLLLLQHSNWFGFGYSIIPFALIILVYGQLSFLSYLSVEAIELLDTYLKTFYILITKTNYLVVLNNWRLDTFEALSKIIIKKSHIPPAKKKIGASLKRSVENIFLAIGIKPLQTNISPKR